MPRLYRLAAAAALLATVTGCSQTVDRRPDSTTPSEPASPATAPQEPLPTTRETPAETTTSGPATNEQDLTGRVLRFAGDDVEVEVTLDTDHAASRDLVARLPLTLSFEEFAGREKIGYLPEKLDAGDSPGSEPDNGDLIYYKPWGNLGFYYNAPRGVDANVIQIGRFDATSDELDRLARGPVTITMLDRR